MRPSGYELHELCRRVHQENLNSQELPKENPSTQYPTVCLRLPTKLCDYNVAPLKTVRVLQFVTMEPRKWDVEP